MGVVSINAAIARASAVSIFFIAEADAVSVLTLVVVGGRMRYLGKDDYCHGNIEAVQASHNELRTSATRNLPEKFGVISELVTPTPKEEKSVHSRRQTSNCLERVMSEAPLILICNLEEPECHSQ